MMFNPFAVVWAESGLSIYLISISICILICSCKCFSMTIFCIYILESKWSKNFRRKCLVKPKVTGYLISFPSVHVILHFFCLLFTFWKSECPRKTIVSTSDSKQKFPIEWLWKMLMILVMSSRYYAKCVCLVVHLFLKLSYSQSDFLLSISIYELCLTILLLIYC